MPSHLSSIGIRIDTREEFAALLDRVVPSCRKTPVRGGAYLLWSGDDGEELWLQIDSDGQGLSMNPHFSGKSSVRVSIGSQVHRPTDTALDGAFECWAEPREGKPDSGAYPLVFDCPDSKTYGSLALPHVGVVQIAAFAGELTCFDSVEEFKASPKATMRRLGSRSFIPTGTFTLKGGTTVPPTAHAIITGHVLESAERKNSLTGDRFVWALVETYGGTYDVVVDGRLLESPPPVGGVISGSFWLSGRLRQGESRQPS
jgi:hypothetical protein